MAEESDRIEKVDSVSIPSLQIIKNEKLPEPVQMVHSPTSCNEDKDMSSDELVIDLGQDDKKACSIVKKRKRFRIFICIKKMCCNSDKKIYQYFA